jgi:hypothetical protein
MRLTSTGLGIGTSSPSTKLQVNGNVYLGGAARNIYADNGSGIFFNGLNNFGSGIYSDGSGTALKFQTSSADRLTLDSSGNLGLGVTPSAWGSAAGAYGIQLNGGALYGYSTTQTGVAQNAYLNASLNWIYRASAAATLYRQDTGAHNWLVAASGTAGNTITFTQAMTLTASGNLLVGATSGSYSIIASGNELTAANPGCKVNSLGTNYGAGSFLNAFTSAGGNDVGFAGFIASQSLQTNRMYAGVHSPSGSNQAFIGTPDANPLAFWTNSAERARITSGGDLQISSGGSFQVGGTAARATTAGTNRVDIFNGTAPVGTLTNGISLYSSSGEAYVMDAAGNATLFSPHDAETNEWVFKSKHTLTGKVLKIDVEKLLRFVNDHFGLDAVHEFVES